MSFISNLSMRGKLIILVLPALLVILLFAGQSIRWNAHQLSNTRDLM